MAQWDGYGEWDRIAAFPEIDAIKESITGNSSGWRPNYCSPALAYCLSFAAAEYRETRGKEPAVLDFGFGLGRNGPLLKKFFPRLIGFDLPSMVSTYRTSQKPGDEPLYDGLYSATADVVEKEDFCLVYDSVVFQHLVDPDTVQTLLEPFNRAYAFRTFVTVSNLGSDNKILVDLLKERNWRLWHSEVETLSFAGLAHTVAVYRQW